MKITGRGRSALWCHWTNTRTRLDALEEHRYLLTGGARGGGKAASCVRALVRWLIETWQIPELREIRVVWVGRETYPDLRDRRSPRSRVSFPRWLGHSGTPGRRAVLPPG
jgi:hypothetical protein